MDDAELKRYAALGKACEAHGLAHFDDAGEMRFQPPAEVILSAAEARVGVLEEALQRARDRALRMHDWIAEETRNTVRIARSSDYVGEIDAALTQEPTP